MSSCVAVLFLSSFAQYPPGGSWVVADSWVPNPDSFHDWGTAVASGVDANGDGWPDLLTTDASRGTTYYPDGHLRLYSGRDGALLWHRILPNVREFGYAACVLGDLDRDGVGEFVVSDPVRNRPASEGVVWIISGSTGETLLEIPAPRWEFDGWHGASLAKAGDMDMDGTQDLLVGAPYGSPAGGYSGEVRVHSGRDGRLITSFKTPRIAGARLGLGTSVHGNLDLDLDGSPDAVAGAPLTDISRGAVIAYSGRSGAELWRCLGAALGSGLGVSLARMPDLDGDGIAELAAGADDRGTGTALGPGRVVVISGRTGAVLVEVPGTTHAGRFGHLLLEIPDQDGDADPDLAVTAPFVPSSSGTGEITLVGSRSLSVLDRFSVSGYPYRFGNSLAYIEARGVDRRPAFAMCTAERSSTWPENRIFILHREPFLHADRTEISLASGGSVQFTLGFPPLEAGQQYLLAGSLAGAGVGQLLGLAVPIAPDRFTVGMHTGGVAGFAGIRGRLDAGASATATWTLATGAPASLLGRTAHFCALTYARFLGRVASLPVGVEFVP